jgi:hypothetical protein
VTHTHRPGLDRNRCLVAPVRGRCLVRVCTWAGLAKRVEINALKEAHHKGEELGEVGCSGGQRRL